MPSSQRAAAARIAPNALEIAYLRSDAGMIAALQRRFWVDADHGHGKNWYCPSSRGLKSPELISPPMKYIRTVAERQGCGIQQLSPAAENDCHSELPFRFSCMTRGL